MILISGYIPKSVAAQLLHQMVGWICRPPANTNTDNGIIWTHWPFTRALHFRPNHGTMSIAVAAAANFPPDTYPFRHTWPRGPFFDDFPCI